jgi:hypothetical protein
LDEGLAFVGEELEGVLLEFLEGHGSGRLGGYLKCKFFLDAIEVFGGAGLGITIAKIGEP